MRSPHGDRRFPPDRRVVAGRRPDAPHRPGPVGSGSQALGALRTGVDASLKSRTALAALGPAAGELGGSSRCVAQCEDELRDEAVWWMTRLDVVRVWEVTVSGGLIAVENRSRRVAVLGREALEVFDVRGRSLQRVPSQKQWLHFVIPRSREFSFLSPDRVEFRGKVDPSDLPLLGLPPQAEWVKDSRKNPSSRAVSPCASRFRTVGRPARWYL